MKLVITDLDNFSIPISGEYRLVKPDKERKTCVGCFGCWLKTPGTCVIHDGMESLSSVLSKCTELIVVSECFYGSTSPFVKSVQDRMISYVQPDFIIRNGEMHHKPRYSNRIAASAYFYGGNITAAEKDVACRLVAANMVNFNGEVKKVEFYKSPQEMEGLTL